MFPSLHKLITPLVEHNISNSKLILFLQQAIVPSFTNHLLVVQATSNFPSFAIIGPTFKSYPSKTKATCTTTRQVIAIIGIIFMIF